MLSPGLAEGIVHQRCGFKLVHPLEDILNLICLLHEDMTGSGWLNAATSAFAALSAAFLEFCIICRD